jgi:hypothetical protein
MRRINPTAVLATLALFVSLGGTSFAAAGLISTSQIENHAVTAHKIAPGAVTTKKIAPNAVTTGKIAPDAVTGAQVQDGSLTGADVAQNTFLPANATANNAAELGGKPPTAFVQGTGNMIANRVLVQAGHEGSLGSLGFGHLTGLCPAGKPEISFIADTSNINLIDSVTTFGSPNGTSDVQTTNGLTPGTGRFEPNTSGLPQTVTWYAAHTDTSGTNHLATAWTTGQDLVGTQCLFTAQAITTG